MTLAEQSAILLEAAEQKLLQPEEIVRWAESVILASDNPPSWVMDLSELKSPYGMDYLVPLREHASVRVALHRRIQIVVLAYLAGRLSWADTLSKIFQVVILDRDEVKRDALEERLTDALVEWDCQEDLSTMEPAVRTKFESLFREYAADAQEVTAVLPWRAENAA